MIVELSARSIQVAVMIEQTEPAKHLLFAASSQTNNPFGSNEAMFGDNAENGQIAPGELK